MARPGEHLHATDVAAGDVPVFHRHGRIRINECMARRLEYVQEEVRVLREALRTATGKSRIAFTVEQRRRLAIKGKALTPHERQGCCQIMRPATILKWFRELAAKPYDGSNKRAPGRPRKPNELRELVFRLANENIGWGYTKIRDALRGMKIEIARTTVAAILAEGGGEPAPERTRKRTWKHFLKSHWETLYACDFFSVETLGSFGTARVMVFFVIELKSRAVHIAGIRVAPDGAWMKQIARNLLDPVDGFCGTPPTLSTIAIRSLRRPGHRCSRRPASRACQFRRAAQTATRTQNDSSSRSAQNASNTLWSSGSGTCAIFSANSSTITTPSVTIRGSTESSFAQIRCRRTTTARSGRSLPARASAACSTSTFAKPRDFNADDFPHTTGCPRSRIKNSSLCRRALSTLSSAFVFGNIAVGHYIAIGRRL